MMSKPTLRSTLLGLLAATQIVNAHTWIEQLMVLADNGTMVGPAGYVRSNVLRSDPSFNDPLMVNLIPPGGRQINDILPTDLMCKSSQTSQTQTDGSPRLQAAAGSAVALRYQENGHVTLPQNQPGKPPNRGTVFVYGTSNPSPDDSFLAIHRVWNAAGTGGDGRGRLLSTQNFDDGQCYQVNGGTISQQRQKEFAHTANSLMGADLWCQQDIALPADAPSGKPYTLYWVWDWPTAPGTDGFPDGKQEIYTTCMDIDIVGSSSVNANSKLAIQFVQGQDLDTAGIATQLADITNPTAVTGQSIAFSASATGPANGQAATQSASAAASPDISSTVPAFLSVHTTSTGGPGLETSIVPIGQVTPTTVPTGAPATQTSNSGNRGGGGRGGHGGHGGSGGGFFGGNGQGGSAQATQTAAPTGTAIVNNNNAVQTFTQFHSVFETVFQTVYNTRFTKRAEPTPEPIAMQAPVVVKTSTCSKAQPVYRLRARLPLNIFRLHRTEEEDC